MYVDVLVYTCVCVCGVYVYISSLGGGEPPILGHKELREDDGRNYVCVGECVREGMDTYIHYIYVCVCVRLYVYV